LGSFSPIGQVMKILLLNPHIDAEHSFVQELRSLAGWSVVCPQDTHEAHQMLALHGEQLDLAVVHREGGGLDFLTKLRAHPRLNDLAVVVTSQDWNDADFARHQGSDQGANAYLKWPCSATALVELGRAIFGGSEPIAATQPAPAVEIPSAGTGLILEDVSQLIEAPRAPSELAISLDAPDPSKSIGSQPIAPAAPDSDGISLGLGLSESSEAEPIVVAPSASEPPVAADLSAFDLPLEMPGAGEPAVDLSASLPEPPSALEER
jgi:hypothetical protein